MYTTTMTDPERRAKPPRVPPTIAPVLGAFPPCCTSADVFGEALRNPVLVAVAEERGVEGLDGGEGTDEVETDDRELVDAGVGVGVASAAVGEKK